jgi:excisionase family DNA binding protein
VEQAEKLPNLSLDQAAEYLQLSPRTVQNLQNRGFLKVVRFGKRRFFRRSDVEKLARQGVSLADLHTEAR